MFFFSSYFLQPCNASPAPCARDLTQSVSIDRSYVLNKNEKCTPLTYFSFARAEDVQRGQGSLMGHVHPKLRLGQARHADGVLTLNTVYESRSQSVLYRSTLNIVGLFVHLSYFSPPWLKTCDVKFRS